MCVTSFPRDAPANGGIGAGIDQLPEEIRTSAPAIRTPALIDRPLFCKSTSDHARSQHSDLEMNVRSPSSGTNCDLDYANAAVSNQAVQADDYYSADRIHARGSNCSGDIALNRD